MKRIINFVLTLIVSMLFLIGCAEPGTNDNSKNNNNNSGGDSVSVNEKVTPGTIEETPEDVQIVINAKEKLAPADDDAILFYYRPDGNYEFWNLWLWADNESGVSVDFEPEFIDIDGKKIAYIDFKKNAKVPSRILEIIGEEGKINFLFSTSRQNLCPLERRHIHKALPERFLREQQ